MNRVFKVIWSKTQQAWVAVGELSKANGKSKSQASTQSLNKAATFIGTVLLTTSLSMTTLPAMAATTKWTGTSGDWFTGSNWDSGIPNNNYAALINNGGTAQITSGTSQALAVNIGSVTSGTGTLSISNGGVLISVSDSNLASSDPSQGSMTVDGTGSLWDNTGQVWIGGRGTGNLSITNGAIVNMSSYIRVGVNSSAVGTLVVDGANSLLDGSDSLYVGEFGNGTLTVSNGGVVDIGTNWITTNIYSTGDGTINIGAAHGDMAVAAGTINAGALSFVRGGSLVFNHTNTAYNFATDIFDQAAPGAIGLYSGTTRFTGDLSGFTGTLTNDGGTLHVASGDILTLGGDYTQTSNGTLKVGVNNSTTYGKLAVTGTAMLDGTLFIDAASASALSGSLTNIITAGSINGTFASYDDNSSLFDFTPVYNANSVDLTVSATSSGDTAYDAVVTTNNSSAIGAAQELDNIFQDDPEGEISQAFYGLEGTQAISQAVAETLPLLVSGTAQVSVNTLHATNRVVQARQSRFSGMSSGGGFITDKHLWIKPVGSWSKQDRLNGVAGYDAYSYGFVGGLDGDLNEFTKLGFAISYMNTDIDGNGSVSNHVDVDSYQAIFYGSHALDNSDIELNWQADIGLNKTEGKRVISFVNRTAQADYDSYTAHIGVGVGKQYTLNDKTTLIPSIRADYAYIKDESYTETGAGALNLNVDDNHYDELIVMAQGNLSHSFNDKVSLVANAGLGYDLINDQTSLTTSYSGGGTAFTTKGIDPSPWLAKAGVGMNYQLNDATEVTAHYDVEGRKDFLNQTASVKLRWMF